MEKHLQQILDDLQTNEAAARTVVEGLTETELNWQQIKGQSWSILQCIDHLVKANSHYVTAMHQVVGEGRQKDSAPGPRNGPVQPSALGAIFIQRLEPPVTKRVGAPRMIVPAESSNPAKVMGDFVESHERIRTVIRDGAALDFNRLKFRNPLFPLLRVRVGTGLLIIGAHERRHLWQANRVRQALEASGPTTTQSPRTQRSTGSE